MDLLETIARSLAEELKPPAGTTIVYTRRINYDSVPEHNITIYSEGNLSMAVIIVKQSGIDVVGILRRQLLLYGDPQSIDRLQEILDEVAAWHRVDFTRVDSLNGSAK